MSTSLEIVVQIMKEQVNLKEVRLKKASSDREIRMAARGQTLVDTGREHQADLWEKV